jgi:hypothetical protein
VGSASVIELSSEDSVVGSASSDSLLSEDSEASLPEVDSSMVEAPSSSLELEPILPELLVEPDSDSIVGGVSSPPSLPRPRPQARLKLKTKMSIGEIRRIRFGECKLRYLLLLIRSALIRVFLPFAIFNGYSNGEDNERDRHALILVRLMEKPDRNYKSSLRHLLF